MTILETIIQTKKEEVVKLKTQPVPLIVDRKKRDSLTTLLQNEQLQVIAEVKRASPSKGDINIDVDPVQQAVQYERAGAACISVLTDAQYFKGSFDDLKAVAESVDIPVLCKDFIIDPIQIDYAYANGASVILLIVAALNQFQLTSLYAYAKTLSLDVLIEVHNEEELERALSLDARLIGVNNRNLKTFDVDLTHTAQLAQKFPFYEDRFLISESGMKRAADAAFVANVGASAVLVGETLMQSGDIAYTMQSFHIKKKVVQNDKR